MDLILFFILIIYFAICFGMIIKGFLGEHPKFTITLMIIIGVLILYFTLSQIIFNHSEIKSFTIKDESINNNLNNFDNAKELEVMDFDDNNEIFITKTQDIYDYKGNHLGKINDKSNYKIENGYIHDNKNIYDRTGNKIYEIDGKYLNISESGILLERKIEESLSDGEVAHYIFVDLKNNNNVILNTTDVYLYYGEKDLFKKADFYDEYIQNKNGNYKNMEENIKGTNYKIIDIKTNKEVEEPHKLYKGGVISLKNNWIFNSENDLITDFNGNTLKDIKEGEAESVYAYGDTIYVITKTGYIYALDKNMNRILQPRKVTDNIIDKDLQEPYDSINIIDEYSNDANYGVYYDNNYFYHIKETARGADLDIYNNKLEKIKTIEHFPVTYFFKRSVNFASAKNYFVISATNNNVYLLEGDSGYEIKKSKANLSVNYSPKILQVEHNKKHYILNLDTLEYIK